MRECLSPAPLLEVEEHKGFSFMMFDLSLLKLVQKNKNEVKIAEKRNLMKNLRTLDPPRESPDGEPLPRKSPPYAPHGPIRPQQMRPPRYVPQKFKETRLFVVILERTIYTSTYIYIYIYIYMCVCVCRHMAMMYT
jgi:hypothetical protein